MPVQLAQSAASKAPASAHPAWTDVAASSASSVGRQSRPAGTRIRGIIVSCSRGAACCATGWTRASCSRMLSITRARQLQRRPPCRSVRLGCHSRPHRLRERLQFRAQRFHCRCRQFLKRKFRLRPGPLHANPQRIAPRIIQRNILVLLEKSHLPHALRGNSARRHIGHRAARKFQPRVRDIHFVRQHRNSHRFHFRHRLLHQRQQDVQVVDHQVVNHVHIQAARRKHSQPVHFKKQRPVHNRLHRQHCRIKSFDVAHLQNSPVPLGRLQQLVRFHQRAAPWASQPARRCPFPASGSPFPRAAPSARPPMPHPRHRATPRCFGSFESEILGDCCRPRRILVVTRRPVPRPAISRYTRAWFRPNSPAPTTATRIFWDSPVVPAPHSFFIHSLRNRPLVPQPGPAETLESRFRRRPPLQSTCFGQTAAFSRHRWRAPSPPRHPCF